MRLVLRAFREWSARYRQVSGKRVLVLGAGDAGEMLIREIERKPALQYHVVGLVDDDPLKLGRRIHGLKVLGTILKAVTLS